MKIRPATEADSERVFAWRNDPITISTSRSLAGVTHDNHLTWFPTELAKPETICLIGEHDGDPCGVVWLRRGRSGVWQTSVNLAPAFRGKRLSVPLLEAALAWAERIRLISKFSTEIKDDNLASVKMFERCGFFYVHPSDGGFGTYCAFIYLTKAGHKS